MMKRMMASKMMMISTNSPFSATIKTKQVLRRMWTRKNTWIKSIPIRNEELKKQRLQRRKRQQERKAPAIS
jgi:hypothetical protein